MRSSIASLALVALGFSTVGPAIAQGAGKAAPARQERAEIRRQIEDLASPDFEVRKRAAKKLEAHGKKARALLEETIEQSDDAEQVWQARRLLRRAEGRRSGLKAGQDTKGARKSGLEPAPRSGAGQAPQSGSSSSGTARGFGIDMRGFPGFEPGDSPEEFARRIHEFMRRQSKLFPHDMMPRGLPGMKIDEQSESSGTQIRVGPEGVEVEISVTKDGKADRKVYKAKSMDELLEKYPELEGKVSGFSTRRGSHFGFGVPDIRGFDRLPRKGTELEELERQIDRMEKHLRELMGRDFPSALPRSGSKPLKPGLPGKPGTGVQPRELKPVPSHGPKLGVYVGAEDTSSIARFLGLPEGVGLAISGLTDDSLASRLGLAKGDLLVQLDDQWIRGPQDVAKVLAGKSKGQALKAQWYRKGKKMQKSTKF